VGSAPEPLLYESWNASEKRSSLTSHWLVAVGSTPKPFLFASVLNAKPFDFLRGPLKLGMKNVGCPNHRPLALGIVCVLCWAQGRPFWVSLCEGCLPFTVAHGEPIDALVINCVERKVKECSCGFC
jgi:hypothetical protein